MAKLEKIFGIRRKDVVSLVGAGGKTSLMYLLGNYFDNSLMTTTTKLFVPEQKFHVGDLPSTIEGSLIAAKKQVEDKLFGFECSEIKSFYNEFDFTFIEADGARMKNLKAWNEFEPVICDFSNKTIGVLDISTVGLNTEETVFRLEEYAKITDLNEVVTIDNLVDIVLSEQGLFKNSNHKILFINKVENAELADQSFELVRKLLMDQRFCLDRIVIGSIFNDSFECVYAKQGVFVLASGMSKRMGQDKLMIEVDGLPLIEHTLKKLSHSTSDLYIVANDHRFDELGFKYGFDVLINPNFEKGQSESIKSSLIMDYHYYTYFLGDMPYLDAETVDKILNTFDDLVACEYEFMTAPATLAYKFREDLLALDGDQGAKSVLKKYKDKVTLISLKKHEVKDIDTPDDLRGEE